MKTTIKFQCPHVGCGEWIITTLEDVCNLKGFYCSFCNKLIHPSMIFGGRFGTGSVDYENEFLAYIGSHVVDLDDLARKNTRLVLAGKIPPAQAQAEIWEGVEKVFRLVRIFKGYNYDSEDQKMREDSSYNDTMYQVDCYCGGA
ncbi:MAG: hypothetical protein KJN62_03590 [Deltaproteobacteria bacterium]|nr:hypothetical protein [Deltaproteobacteria bacterium]